MTTIEAMPETLAPPSPATQPLMDRLALAFREYVQIEHEAGQSRLRTPYNVQTLRAPDAGLLAALARLSGAGAGADELAELVQAHGGELAVFYYRLGQWKNWRLLRYTLHSGGEPLLTLEPIGFESGPTPQPIDPDQPLVLSRFALFRRFQEALILESPLAHVRISLAPRAAALLGALAQPHSARGAAELLALPLEDVADLFSLLATHRLLAPLDAEGQPAESADETLQQWNFHDLLFHSRSRTGRHDYLFGATYRFLQTIEPLPAVKPPMSEELIPLARVDIEQLKAADLPFTQVFEERRSWREYGETPISLEQLGEFLYRVARVRAIVPRFSSPGQVYEASNRPYAGGGAGYELELYLSVNRCDGLESGLYHYDPLNHQLERLSGRTRLVEQLLEDASTSAARLCVPQVLITYAARFQRMGWKYDSMAYAATLKNVGALYQAMYLVATAMNLAPCGLGSGNSDLLARAAGLDYLKESSVGEFMLGSRRRA